MGIERLKRLCGYFAYFSKSNRWNFSAHRASGMRTWLCKISMARLQFVASVISTCDHATVTPNCNSWISEAVMGIPPYSTCCNRQKTGIQPAHRLVAFRTSSFYWNNSSILTSNAQVSCHPCTSQNSGPGLLDSLSYLFPLLREAAPPFDTTRLHLFCSQ